MFATGVDADGHWPYARFMGVLLERDASRAGRQAGGRAGA